MDNNFENNNSDSSNEQLMKKISDIEILTLGIRNKSKVQGGEIEEVVKSWDKLFFEIEILCFDMTHGRVERKEDASYYAESLDIVKKEILRKDTNNEAHKLLQSIDKITEILNEVSLS